MGTNYYLVPPGSDILLGEVVEHLHVAKVSGGWRVVFQAYGLDYERERGVSPQRAGTLQVGSVEQWRMVIERGLREGWRFVDEYGRDADQADFWALVEEHQDGRAHDDPRYHFRDPAGFDFCVCDFT